MSIYSGVKYWGHNMRFIGNYLSKSINEWKLFFLCMKRHDSTYIYNLGETICLWQLINGYDLLQTILFQGQFPKQNFISITYFLGNIVLFVEDGESIERMRIFCTFLVRKPNPKSRVCSVCAVCSFVRLGNKIEWKNTTVGLAFFFFELMVPSVITCIASAQCCT